MGACASSARPAERRSRRSLAKMEIHTIGGQLNWVGDIGRGAALFCPMETNPDPHGQAALMLCEGLMLLLVEKGVIDKSRVADVIDGVIEVKQEIAGVRESVVVSVTSIALLQAVARSISAAAGPDRLTAS